METADVDVTQQDKNKTVIQEIQRCIGRFCSVGGAMLGDSKDVHHCSFNICIVTAVTQEEEVEDRRGGDVVPVLILMYE